MRIFDFKEVGMKGMIDGAFEVLKIGIFAWAVGFGVHALLAKITSEIKSELFLSVHSQEPSLKKFPYKLNKK